MEGAVEREMARWEAVVRDAGALHDREYFSRNRGLNDKGLNPWDASFKLIVSNQELADVFGTATSPVALRKARNVDANFLVELKNKVFGKAASNSVSLAFARGAIASHKGLTVDWATFAFEAQFRGPRKRAKLSKCNKSLAAMGTTGPGVCSRDTSRSSDDGGEVTFDIITEKATAVSQAWDEVQTSLEGTVAFGDWVEMIGEIQAELRHVRRELNRVEKKLLNQVSIKTGTLGPARGGSPDLETRELAETLSKLFRRQTDLQQDFVNRLWQRRAGEEAAGSNKHSALCPGCGNKELP